MAQLLLRPPLPMIPSQFSVCSKGEQAAATTSYSSCSCLNLGSSGSSSSRRRRRRRRRRSLFLSSPSSSSSHQREWCRSAAAAVAAAAAAAGEEEAKIEDGYEGEMDDMRMMRVLMGEEKQEEEDAWKNKLSGRERRALKNRNRGAAGGRRKKWKEEEEVMDGSDHLLITYDNTQSSANYINNNSRMMKKKKEEEKEGKSFNFNSLSKLGPQWWTLYVNSRRREISAQRLLESFNRSFPQFPFKVHAPVLRLKRRLKNGSISVRTKAIYPTFLFIHCVLNREIHDFIRASYAIGGFVGPRIRIPNSAEITKPKPVPDMETVFEEERRQQEIADREFNEQEASEEESPLPRRKQTRKKSTSSRRKSTPGNGSDEPLLLGSDVRVLSGPFSGFTGRLKEMDHENGKAMVIFMLFGGETGCKFDVDQIVPVSSVTNL